jgi:hypothetical protein
LIERAKGLGLHYQVQDLPVEDIDQEKLKKSLLTSLTALVPYTKAWNEAHIAEDDFDNLPNIIAERIKAKELLTMTTLGQHEKALAIMRAETDNDFFYFNRLKSKLEGEGKYMYEEQVYLKQMKTRCMKNKFALAIGTYT